jgi:5-methylcytosine-specific restriction protein B
LWELFEYALQYVENPTGDKRETVGRYFDLAMSKKGMGNSKLTIGLYWIAPYDFISLDKHNVQYIYKSGEFPEEHVASLPEIEGKIPSGKYFAIVKKLKEYALSTDKYKSFPELSHNAWLFSKEKGRAIRDSKGDGLADEDVSTVHYWIYSPGDNASMWDEFYEKGIMGIGWDDIGDLLQYSSKDEMQKAMKERIGPNFSFRNSALATWQFVHEMKPGDIVFAKKGQNQIVGWGIVETAYYYDPSENEEYPNLRKVKWKDKGEWEHPGKAVTKTLTDITQYTQYVEKLLALFGKDTSDEEIEAVKVEYPTYTENDFLNEVYMEPDTYYSLVDRVKNKMNVILQGPPGVGKTYAAKRLAYSIMGIKDPERVMMIQFHQSYSYEDFIEGYRPVKGGGFDIEKGVFYEFCNKAELDPENEYFFIIDEINRGNISKIFGELFMLIESDKRGNTIRLLYSGDGFMVPKNLYIIGTMNTADRSLAMLDYALRRRFAFFNMKPAFDYDGFREYRIKLKSEKFDELINCVERLNSEIVADDSLGEGFCIGHSYFCGKDEIDDSVLSGIVEYELIPLLKEYWYDDPQKVKDWAESLRRAIK